MRTELKKIMLSITLCASSIFANSQMLPAANKSYFSVGPVAGVGFNAVSNLHGYIKFVPSTLLGVGMIFARREHSGWGAQVAFSSEGYDVKWNNTTANVTALYIRIPLRYYHFFGSYKNLIRPKLFLGPSFGFNISEKGTASSNNTDQLVAMNTGKYNFFDAGIHGGAGLNIQLSHAVWLNLDAVYYQGLTDAINDANDNYNTNQNIGINAGLYIGVR